MRVLLVVPTIPELRPGVDGVPIGCRIFRVPFAGILAAAGRVPAPHTVTVIDEHIERVDLEGGWDLVGLTVAAATAPRAFALARGCRARKIPVFAGGFHPSFDPEGCLDHFDSVVVGEAEGSVEALVADAARGALRRRYERGQPCDPADIRPLPLHLVRHPEQYFTINVITATRGCPHYCRFCGVRQFHRGGFRARPVAAVVAELRAMRGRRVLFTDDNLVGDPRWARELFRAMTPLRRWWLTQMSVEVTDDEELVRLAARAGCLGVFIGLETLSDRALLDQRKHQNRRRDYRRAIRTLHRHGISVAAGTMFGFDHDDPGVFERTLDFLLDAGVDVVQVDPLTPFPGTPLYAELEREGRIRVRDLEQYNIGRTVFEPRGMTALELEQGVRDVRRRFYAGPRVAARTARILWRRGPVAALVLGALNWGYHRHLALDLGYPP